MMLKSATVYFAFLDFALALYPITVFWTLQMSLKKKIGVCLLLSLGVVAGGVAVEKTTRIPDLGKRKDLPCKPSL